MTKSGKQTAQTKKQNQSLLQSLTYLDEAAKTQAIEEYLLEAKVKHTIELIKWYGVVN